MFVSNDSLGRNGRPTRRAGLYKQVKPNFAHRAQDGLSFEQRTFDDAHLSQESFSQRLWDDVPGIPISCQVVEINDLLQYLGHSKQSIGE
ncbi:hypothetical protein N7540_007365 [Penicillium herquei]|nr:hypothetical protein N7540_007365 [Penicillium herquei]